MDAVRAAVGLGRGLRVAESLKTRQPLRQLTVVSHDASVLEAIEAHTGLIADELNVKTVATSTDEASLAHLTVKANFRQLGPRFGSRMKEAAAAINGLDVAAIQDVLDGGSIEILDEVLGVDDLIVERVARDGVVVATGDSLSVALDTALDEELLREGLAREIVKTIQGLRREAGLDVSDRIQLRWDTNDAAVEAAFSAFSEWITAETLAVRVERSEGGSSYHLGDVSIDVAVDRA
jgi:isoleucyl-tRNA synthetase